MTQDISQYVKDCDIYQTNKKDLDCYKICQPHINLLDCLSINTVNVSNYYNSKKKISAFDNKPCY